MNELVATYVMDDVLYDVFACYTSDSDMDTRNVSFYDVYNQKTGECVTEGDPCHSMPTWHEIFHTYYSPVR
jgi:hypothetical protein